MNYIYFRYFSLQMVFLLIYVLAMRVNGKLLSTDPLDIELLNDFFWMLTPWSMSG